MRSSYNIHWEIKHSMSFIYRLSMSVRVKFLFPSIIGNCFASSLVHFAYKLLQFKIFFIQKKNATLKTNRVKCNIEIWLF